MRTYVFDLDGTLINSSRRHYLLMEWLLRKMKIYVTSDFSAAFMQYKTDGNSGKKYLLDVLNLDSTDAEIINSEWIKNIENDDLLIFDYLYSDTLDVLDKIKDRGDVIFFLTARNNENGLREEILRLGLEKYPCDTVVITPGRSKTESLMELLSMKANNENTERYDRFENSAEIIVVGDTEADYNAAIETGVDYYILNRGFRSKRYWDERNVRSHNNLFELVEI